MWVRTPDSTTRLWANALTYANGLTLCGYSDWRLPNRKELRSLSNYAQANSAAWLNTQGFSNVQGLFYWSSSTFARNTTYALFVDMYHGADYVNNKDNWYYSWPVRAGGGGATADLPKTGQTTSYAAGDDGDLEKGVAWPSTRFTVDGTGFCVTDNLTGLMWVRTPDSTTRLWANALTYANGLTLCGYSDWRLPNRKELRSLSNYAQANSAAWLNTQGFSNVQGLFYWSSSTLASGTAVALYVNMYSGVSFYGKGETFYVWPVRAGQ
jgi:virulence-associated protein VapD